MIRNLVFASLSAGLVVCSCQPGRDKEVATNQVRPVEIQKRGRGLTIRVQGAGDVEPGDHIDLLFCLEDPGNQQMTSFTGLVNVIVLRVDHVRTKDSSAIELTVLVLPEEAELLGLACKVGTVHASLRAANDIGSAREPRPVAVGNLIVTEGIERLLAKRIGLRLATSVDAMGTRALSKRVPEGGRALRLPVQGVRHVRAGDRIDLLATFQDPLTGQWVTSTLLERVFVLRPDGEAGLGLLVLPEEAAFLVLASQVGELRGSMRHLEDTSTLDEHARTTLETLLSRPGISKPDHIEIIRTITSP